MPLTILGASAVIFYVIRQIPGDPVVIMLGIHATGANYEQLAHALGLDQPIFVQYFFYIWRVFMGDWGASIYGHEPVLPYVLARFAATLALTTVSLVFSALIGISLGIFAAMRQGSIVDHICRILSLSFFSVPLFWSGSLFILIFSVYLHILPSMGRSMVLPAATLALWACGPISRIARASVLDVENQDFVRIARGKGISYRRLWINHILRNAFVPIITVIGSQFGMLIGGAAITEAVFSYPGVGLLIIDGIFMRDYPVVQGAVLFLSIFVCMTNFLSDVSYALLDPRITFG